MVRTFFDATFSWTTDAYSGSGTTAGATVYSQLGSTGVDAPSNANAGAVAGGTLGVYYAFIQFARFTIGKAVSQFDAPWTHYPGNNFDGLVGGGGKVWSKPAYLYRRLRRLLTTRVTYIMSVPALRHWQASVLATLAPMILWRNEGS